MQVKLLAPTEPREPIRRCWVATRTCQSRKDPYDLWLESEKLTNEKMIELLRKCYESNHLSVFRHAEFTFSIGGISRACSHQLVRHHVGFSPEQQSQRAVDPKYFDFVTPPSFVENSLYGSLEYKYDELKGEAEAYIKGGIPEEDARYVLPAGVTTNLVITANLNSLIHVSRERLCSLAQWEIRRLVAGMRAELGKVHPWTREMLVISCMAQGYCTQLGNKDGHCKVRPYATSQEVTKALLALRK